MHQWTWHCNSSVVDQSEQGLSIELLAHLLGGGLNSCLIGNIKEQRDEILSKFLGKPFGILRFSYAPKHAESMSNQNLGDAPANPGGDSSHDDALHKIFLSSVNH
jgi:hypothetical protein